MTSFIRSFAALALLLAPGNGVAQQRTTAVYGDWTLSCTSAPEAGNAKSCGLVQIQKFGNQAPAASQLGIGRNKSAEAFRVSIEIPPDVWMPAGVKLTSSGNPLISAQFKWCISTRCLADAELSDSDIKNLRAQKAPVVITYRTSSQSDVAIPVSFNGFSEAFDALQKQ
jgi:invasion protein IalB